jgi:hypothetical protein
MYFCRDCQGCSNCIGCCGLRNKSFYVFNKQVSAEEFKNIVNKFENRDEIKKTSQQFQEFSQTLPFRASYIINCENVTGDHLLNCKNSEYCFEAEGLEDCKYIYTIPKNATDSHDAHYSQNSELCYDCISSVNDYKCKFVLHSWDCKNSSYVQECYYSNDLFGCVGLKNSKYCILNKQYSQTEYEAMVARIIEHMTKTGEWGKYFHPKLSLFAYNESLAQEFFPLTKEEALKNGYAWKERDEMEYQPAGCEVPDNIDRTEESIVGKILACTDCGKNYKIITQELNFYRKNKIPAPIKCLDCRHKERTKTRSLRHLWDRKCDKCDANIKTGYSPDGPEIVYCEKCYLESII